MPQPQQRATTPPPQANGGGGGGGRGPLSQPQRLVILSFFAVVAYLFCLEMYGGGYMTAASDRGPAILEAFRSTGGSTWRRSQHGAPSPAAALDMEMIRDREQQEGDKATAEVEAKAKAQAEAEAKAKAEAEAKAAAAAADNPEARCLAQEWIQKHAQLQREMVEGARPKRFLVFRPDCGYCGMCNRLNAILGHYMWAVLTDRAFVIDWRYPGKHGWTEGTHYLDPRALNWTADYAVGKPTFEWETERCVFAGEGGVGWMLVGCAGRIIHLLTSRLTRPDTPHRMIEGWEKLREMLKNTTFAEFEQDEAIIVKMVGESPTRAFMCVS
jgi:hypothetical protein